MKLQGTHSPESCPCCSSDRFQCQHIYQERPTGETDFKFDDYNRELWRCQICGHFLSTTSMNLSTLYAADYVDKTYGGSDGVRQAYEWIMGLDPDKSDNVGRVDRIVQFAQQHFENETNLKVLDIGSGLGVFLGRVRQITDWICTALEPDPRLAKHAEQTLGVESVTEDYRKLEWDRKFDIICLNKVLEHIEQPLDVLERCRSDLAPGGFLYLELPDGEAAADDTDEYCREEFYLEHHHVFSMASMELLIRKAGFLSIELERLREPSTKYTLRSFLVQKVK
jgi:SAM-dependent methyltransferase